MLKLPPGEREHAGESRELYPCNFEAIFEAREIHSEIAPLLAFQGCVG